jgi:RING finger protein 165
MAGAAPDASKVKGNAPTISTSLCIALAVVILIGVCIARKTNTLAALQEVAARTRSSLRGRGLDDETINSIPIVRYTGRRNSRANDDYKLGARPPLAGSGLETIPEDSMAIQGLTPGQPRGGIRIHARSTLARWRALIPKRPTPRLRRPDPELSRQEDTSCSICTEEFSGGSDLRKLPCGHLYHPRCIDQWLRDFGVTCPLWQVSSFIVPFDLD